MNTLINLAFKFAEAYALLWVAVFAAFFCTDLYFHFDNPIFDVFMRADYSAFKFSTQDTIFYLFYALELAVIFIDEPTEPGEVNAN